MPIRSAAAIELAERILRATHSGRSPIKTRLLASLIMLAVQKDEERSSQLRGENWRKDDHLRLVKKI